MKDGLRRRRKEGGRKVKEGRRESGGRREGEGMEGRKAGEGRKEGEGRKQGTTLVGVPRKSMIRNSWWTQFLPFQGEGRKEGKKEGRKVFKGRKVREGR